ncbi:MAG TPA: cation:proton antiporter [Chryseosolibacter sp.]|nr:cation:proton antiporter [Chryseosolibacter sp.]
MGHLPDLIHDLALILIAGAVTTIVFRKIKQPLVLGYIIAGFLVGPHFHLAPTVADSENVEILAEIGVIFLLFSLGLEFSFKKLMRVGGSASITALVEIVFITVAGYFVGIALGWSTMDSLFLGGMLASSSTTIIIRAFDELGVKTKQYARIVFGVLIVEDIVVILLMVLLSTIAVTQQFEGGEIIYTVLKLLFFLALWFIAGIFLLPTFLRRVKTLMDQETLLILSLGLCLGMVVLATKAGFSAELGAFIMGSILAETTSAEKIEHITKPVKDLFGAIFFVSVGMMIDPQAIITYGWPVICVTLLTLFGKLFSTTLGALLSGQPLKQSVQVGMSMAQIGEFAFIVATLGLSLGVISDFLFPVAVGASAITTFTTPYMIKGSEQLYKFLERKLPPKMLARLNRYSSGAQSIQAETEWRTVLRAYVNIILTNAIMLLAIFVLVVKVIKPVSAEYMSNALLRHLLTLLFAIGIAMPFLWAMMAKRPSKHFAYKELWMINRYNRGPLLILEVLRILAGLTFISFLTFELFPAGEAFFVIVPLIILVLFLFAKRIQDFYQRLEMRFVGNLNARETVAFNTLDANVSRKNADLQSTLLPWDAHIVPMEVPRQADYIGRTLGELSWRERFGINIVYIKRGDIIINTPGRNNILLPFDHAGILGTDDQIQKFKPAFHPEDFGSTVPSTDLSDIVLQKILVDEHTKLKGADIRSSQIREATEGLVIGVERRGERILNPDSTLVLEWNDVIWLVGNRKKIELFTKRKGTVSGSEKASPKP